MSRSTEGAIVYLDDNVVDLKLMQSCHGLSECVSPLLTMRRPDELFAHMRSVATGEQPPPELLLIDIRMPEMDGFAVVEKLASVTAGQLPRVVFFTTSQRPEDEQTAAAMGAELVRKPSDVDDYVALLSTGFRP